MPNQFMRNMKNHQKSGTVLICIALIIVVATIATAGCANIGKGQITATGNQQSEHPAAGTPLVPATTKTPEQPVEAQLAPASSPSTPFITIDPIGDKNTGDLIIISGTTNLPSGASVYLKAMNESTGESMMMANTFACPDAHRVNRWRFVYDSTDWMRPGRQRYLVSTPMGDVNSSVQFNLKGTFIGPEKILYYDSGSKFSTIRGTGAPYITINPIGDRQIGDIFRISGTTNLIEGTMLYGTVWPVYYEDKSKKPSNTSDDFCDGQYNMVGYAPAVVKGTGDTNRWSFPADMTIQTRTEMIVHVSTVNEEFTERDVYGNATFTLK